MKKYFSIPRTIYKYLDYDCGLKIIENKTVKFNHSSLFNDPFDCNIDLFDFTGDENQIRNYFNTFYKGLSIEHLNKLVDYSINNRAEFEKELKTSLQNSIDNMSISCFSKAADNTLLWSYYGDKHQGMCFEFYSDFAGLTFMMRTNLQYRSKAKINFFEDPINNYVFLFGTKSEEWKHEDEIRLLWPNRPGPAFLEFSPSNLKRVILGCRFDMNKLDELQEKLWNNGFHITEIDIAIKKGFELKIENI